MEENGFGSNDSNIETTTTANDTAVDLSLQRKHTAMLEHFSDRYHSRLAEKFVIDSKPLMSLPHSNPRNQYLSKFSQSKVYIESCLSQIHQQEENQIPSSDSNPKIDIKKISL
ncbi:tubulin-folding cofactor C [Forsythia ovata]|uniref:Tubulin-folding cofactor C n=1 Tax=Forsythia ovata TaxID=205694 RepID=A0ABD1W8R6_9LAMI